jgi:hypothetical protein
MEDTLSTMETHPSTMASTQKNERRPHSLDSIPDPTELWYSTRDTTWTPFSADRLVKREVENKTRTNKLMVEEPTVFFSDQNVF